MTAHTLMPHLCRVCWALGPTHSDWQLHAIHDHGADARDPILRTCHCMCRHAMSGKKPTIRDCLCPGVRYSKTPPNFGQPVKRRYVDRDAPIRGRDGNLYTPQRLPI